MGHRKKKPRENVNAPFNHLLTGRELAQRWGRSETAIGLSAAVGVGPRYVKIGGAVRYPVEEVQRFERACMLFNPADVDAETLA